MVRKSERNKHDTPDKTVEKPTPRKSGRQTRRRKKSTSESEPEAEVNVEKEPVPVPVQSRESPKPQQVEATADIDSKNKVSTRRSTRSKVPVPEVVPEVEVEIEKEPENKKISEKDWKEDDQFWGEQSAKQEEQKVEEKEEDGGTTWKVQSSNGSGGEIQKLKICRQRLTDSAESSSSPAKESSSPRRKRYTKRMTKSEKPDAEGTESTSSHTDSEAQANSISFQDEIVPSEEPENLLNEKEVEQDEVELSAEPSIEISEKEEGELDKTVDTEKDEAITIAIDEVNQEYKIDSIDSTEKDDAETVKADVDIVTTSKSLIINSEETQKSTDSEEIDSAVVVEVFEPLADRNDEKESSEETLKEPIKKSGKNLKLSVSNEMAMEQIAKKLNERAAAKGAKESIDEKDKKVAPTENVSKTPEPELDTTKEEGEISSAETPEPFKMAKSTIIINKTKPEPSIKPTSLKRTTEEIPAAQRKRRISSKTKLKEPQITISSQTLKLIVPDVQPVPLEEVKELLTVPPAPVVETPPPPPERKRSVSVEDPKGTKKKLIELKEVEVRVENDVREVKKKKPIVIDHKDDTAIKSELTTKVVGQENHKAARKISIVSDDAKALRRSTSPSSKKATSVLFITNLVRPFTVPQLKELLARTGTLAPNGFYIDKIKSKCYVKYSDVEMAVETRSALHGVRWPINNPKTLKVEYSTEQSLNVMLQIANEEHNAAKKQEAAAIDKDSNAPWHQEQKPPSKSVSSRRVTTSVREWDMGKMAGNENQIPNQTTPSEPKKSDDWTLKSKEKPKIETENRRRAHSPEKVEPNSRKIKKRDTDAPARLLDDLFRKTKATPCIYWLPLTTAQIAVKEEMRRQHMAENERRLAEFRKTDSSRREKEKERDRERERDRDRDRRKK